jgi:hypothetical protein
VTAFLTFPRKPTRRVSPHILSWMNHSPWVMKLSVRRAIHGKRDRAQRHHSTLLVGGCLGARAVGEPIASRWRVVPQACRSSHSGSRPVPLPVSQASANARLSCPTPSALRHDACYQASCTADTCPVVGHAIGNSEEHGSFLGTLRSLRNGYVSRNLWQGLSFQLVAERGGEPHGRRPWAQPAQQSIRAQALGFPASGL